MPNVQSFSTLRARSYVFRLPLFTRCISFLIVALWVVGVQSVWDLRQWGALIPDEFNFQTGKWQKRQKCPAGQNPPGEQAAKPIRLFVRWRRAEGRVVGRRAAKEEGGGGGSAHWRGTTSSRLGSDFSFFSVWRNSPADMIRQLTA